MSRLAGGSGVCVCVCVLGEWMFECVGVRVCMCVCVGRWHIKFSKRVVNIDFPFSIFHFSFSIYYHSFHFTLHIHYYNQLG